ncbi:hypothetical protein [Stenotrophomonas rhizophila]|uniref:hypothetical protein n=1 Tax=Stenotrophomonas rhizophila TaxID=216778 RepID=UPI0010C13C4C|nr:hypothetical protein [Stenotrophomonas rhizophila]TKK07565.1 hypothetical protein SrhCFBP13529_12395 [Stenotrophomonas rhizophila]
MSDLGKRIADAIANARIKASNHYLESEVKRLIIKWSTLSNALSGEQHLKDLLAQIEAILELLEADPPKPGVLDKLNDLLSKTDSSDGPQGAVSGTSVK